MNINTQDAIVFLILDNAVTIIVSTIVAVKLNRTARREASAASPSQGNSLRDIHWG